MKMGGCGSKSLEGAPLRKRRYFYGNLCGYCPPVPKQLGKSSMAERHGRSTSWQKMALLLEKTQVHQYPTK